MRQLTTQTAYMLTHDGVAYCVTLVRINNDANGNPRYEAHIVDLEDLAQDDMASACFRYRFTGHYMSDRKEAEWVLNQALANQ